MQKGLSSRIRLQRVRTNTVPVDGLERWKSLASIASAIAIPFVLAIAGYFIQKQLANDGLKKDYVSIAAGILKENPEGQEPDLRKWAVDILEKNSPIPFTPKAKRSLEQGLPIIMPGPIVIPPIEDCMQPPREIKISKALSRLDASVKKGNKNNESLESLLKNFMAFVDAVVAEQEEAGKTKIRLECMQSWASSVVEQDNDWRKYIGAPDSKSEYERVMKEKAAEVKEKKADAPS